MDELIKLGARQMKRAGEIWKEAWPFALWTLFLLVLSQPTGKDAHEVFKQVISELAAPKNLGLVLCAGLTGFGVRLILFGNAALVQHTDDGLYHWLETASRKVLTGFPNFLVDRLTPGYMGMMLGSLGYLLYSHEFLPVLLVGPVGLFLLHGLSAWAANVQVPPEKLSPPQASRVIGVLVVIAVIYAYLSGHITVV